MIAENNQGRQTLTSSFYTHMNTQPHPPTFHMCTVCACACVCVYAHTHTLRKIPNKTKAQGSTNHS